MEKELAMDFHQSVFSSGPIWSFNLINFNLIDYKQLYTLYTIINILELSSHCTDQKGDGFSSEMCESAP